MMGAGVGLTIGFIFGSYSILRYAIMSPFDWFLRHSNALTEAAQVREGSCQRFHSTCLAVLPLSRSSLLLVR